MEFLVSLAAGYFIGQAAKRRGREGLRWGAGIAAVLLASSSILGFYNQAVGVAPYLWWVIAAIVVGLAWFRLEGKGSEVSPPKAPEPSATPSAAQQPSALPAAPPAHEASGLARFLGKSREDRLAAVLALVVVVVVAASKLMPTGQDSAAPTATAAAPTTPTAQAQATPAATAKSVVWDCVNAKNTSTLWRRMQFDDDGVYSYVGDATGTPSWGRWSKDSETVMRMTVDEDDRWVTWSITAVDAGRWQMANTFGLTVICQGSSARLTRPSGIPPAPQQAQQAATSQAAPPSATQPSDAAGNADPQAQVRRFFEAVDRAKANPDLACQGQAAAIERQVGLVLRQYTDALQQMPAGPQQANIVEMMGRAATAGIGNFSPSCLK
jgi:hypothetical protein